MRSLPSRASVVVYSAERLALSGPGVKLSGPGVKMDTLPPSFHYRFEYQGFRLLLDQAGTCYLLPVGWSPRLDITYVLSDTDPVRVELVPGAVRPERLVQPGTPGSASQNPDRPQ